jgi:regulatory protein
LNTSTAAARGKPECGVTFQPPSLKGRALRLLSVREHSRSELARKLAAHEVEPGTLARVLDELQAKGLIDEQRVLESVLHRRSPQFGSHRIRQELQAKGLDKEAIAQALDTLRSSEWQRARDLLAQKFGPAATDMKERAKQARFMLARGFDPAIVRRALAEARAGEAEAATVTRVEKTDDAA